MALIGVATSAVSAEAFRSASQVLPRNQGLSRMPIDAPFKTFQRCVRHQLSPRQNTAVGVDDQQGRPERLGKLFSSPVKAGDRIRTGDVQLGKLTFYH
jgi:hypothetical protein